VSRALLILGVLTALVASGFASAAGAPERPAAAPSLRLVHAQPFTVAGKGFGARERIRMTVAHEEQTVVRLLRANRTGSFVAGFAELTPRRCAGWLARAIGARGSRAILKLAAPACQID